MSVQINLVLYFHQARVRKRRTQKSVLKHLNLGKVAATAGAHNGGFSGYSSPSGLISLCIFRLWVFSSDYRFSKSSASAHYF